MKQPELGPQAREIRKQWSAAKARGYFEEFGPGMLVTSPLDASPFAQWMKEMSVSGITYANRYLTLAELREREAPGFSEEDKAELASAIRMVEGYDPETQAVVVIQYSAEEEMGEPEVVELPGASESDRVN